MEPNQRIVGTSQLAVTEQRRPSMLNMGYDLALAERHLSKLRHGLGRLEADEQRLRTRFETIAQQRTPQHVTERDEVLCDCYAGTRSALSALRWVEHMTSDAVVTMRSDAHLALLTMLRPMIDGIVGAGYFAAIPHGWLLAEAAHIGQWGRRRDDKLWADFRELHEGLDQLEDFHELAMASGWIPADVDAETFVTRLRANIGPTSIAGRARKLLDVEGGLTDEVVEDLIRIEALLSDRYMHLSGYTVRAYAESRRPPIPEFENLLAAGADAPMKVRQVISLRLQKAGHKF